MDYYGKRLATCSSDKTIKLFDIEGDSYKHITTLLGYVDYLPIAFFALLLKKTNSHEGPVWSLSFAHPKFGTILASASFDAQVFIWRPVATATSALSTTWEIIARHTAHTASVNSVEFSPPEYGAMLVCASSDGNVSVVEFKDDGSIDSLVVSAHAGGCNAAVWAPFSVEATAATPKRFASGGCDGMVRIWAYDITANTYTEEKVLEGHSDWVRDLAFAPSVVSSRVYLASGGQDGKVIIHVYDSGNWSKKIISLGEVVWKVSWSLSGNVLAVSVGEDKVSLYKETRSGDWEICGDVDQ